LGEGVGKRDVAERFDTQALSPTLSQRERELKKLAIGNWQKEVI